MHAEGELARQCSLCGMIGRDPAMQQLFALIRRYAPHARVALITGETGSGKELVAKALHQLGPRSDRRLVTLNCSAVVETLVETELFGHVRGAFTGASQAKPGLFEVADGGTLFLDEVGELPLPSQAKLLRVLETGEVQRVGAVDPRRVNVRIVAATHRDLRREVRAGRFREDLLYRLTVVTLAVPPLAQHRGDIPYLTAAFVKEFAERFGRPISGVSPTAEQRLAAAPWPGNVRELRHTLERACILAEGRVISERELAECLEPTAGRPSSVRSRRVPQGSEVAPLAELERAEVIHALREVRGNMAAAARLLGLSRRALYRRLERHGLTDGAADAKHAGR